MASISRTRVYTKCQSHAVHDTYTINISKVKTPLVYFRSLVFKRNLRNLTKRSGVVLRYPKPLLLNFFVLDQLGHYFQVPKFPVISVSFTRESTDDSISVNTKAEKLKLTNEFGKNECSIQISRRRKKGLPNDKLALQPTSCIPSYRYCLIIDMFCNILGSFP